jgi:hypothetical protein
LVDPAAAEFNAVLQLKKAIGSGLAGEFDGRLLLEYFT